MIKRERKVDIEKMDEEQAKVVQVELIKKITEINDEAVRKAQNILKIYGMDAIMEMRIDTIENIKALKEAK